MTELEIKVEEWFLDHFHSGGISTETYNHGMKAKNDLIARLGGDLSQPLPVPEPEVKSGKKQKESEPEQGLA